MTCSRVYPGKRHEGVTVTHARACVVSPAEELARLVKKQDEDGRTLLHSAATSGSLQLVQFLVDHGAAATVDSADEEVRQVAI